MREGDQGSPPHSKRSGGGGCREGSRHGGGGGALEVKPANMKVGGGGGSATRGNRPGSSKGRLAILGSMEEEGSFGQQEGEGSKPSAREEPGSVSAPMEEGKMDLDSADGSRSRNGNELQTHGQVSGGVPCGSNGTVTSCERAESLTAYTDSNGTVTMVLDPSVGTNSRVGEFQAIDNATREMDLDSHVSVLACSTTSNRTEGHRDGATRDMESDANCIKEGNGNTVETHNLDCANRETLNCVAETTPTDCLIADSGQQQLSRLAENDETVCNSRVVHQVKAPDQSKPNGHSISSSTPGSIARLAAITGMPMQSSPLGACGSRDFRQGKPVGFGLTEPPTSCDNTDCMDASMCLGMSNQ